MPKDTQHGGGGLGIRQGGFHAQAWPPHLTSAHQRQEAHCQADPSSETSDTSRSRGTRSPCGRQSWLGRHVAGPVMSALTLTPRFSAEVKLVGLEGSDKLSILRGCPGLPGAPGLKGETGAAGLKGACPGWGRGWWTEGCVPWVGMGPQSSGSSQTRARAGLCPLRHLSWEVWVTGSAQR